MITVLLVKKNIKKKNVKSSMITRNNYNYKKCSWSDELNYISDDE